MVVNFSRTFARGPPSPAPSHSPTSLKTPSCPDIWKRVISASKIPTFQYLKENFSTDTLSSTGGSPTPPISPKKRQYTPGSSATSASLPRRNSTMECERTVRTREEWNTMPLVRREAALERVNDLRNQLRIPEKNLDGSVRPKKGEEGYYDFIGDYAESKSPL